MSDRSTADSRLPRATAAVRAVMEPLAAYAQRCGLDRKSFAALAAAVFGDACGQAAASLPHDAGIRLVGRWLTDPAYSRRGKPRALARTGQRSFAQLVQDADAGNWERVLQALVQSGTAVVSRGRVRLAKPVFLAAAGEGVDALGRYGGEFLKLIVHNLTCGPEETFLQRTASYDNVGSSSLKMLRRRLRREGESAVLGANSILASRDRDRRPRAPGGRRTRVSFGVYYFEEPVSPRKASRQR